VTEADLQALIVDVAETYGWLVFHDNDSRRNNPGFPDLVLVKPPRVVFMECKSEKGKLRPEQQVWMGHLLECDTVASAVVRPEHLDLVIEYLQRSNESD
tara:strand:+ start:17 stop:313 length:297 start_codon:yes stop_codon:yes gene_type:complete